MSAVVRVTDLPRTRAALHAYDGHPDDGEDDHDTARAWAERMATLEGDVGDAYHRDTAGELTRTEAESPPLCNEDIDALRLLCACEGL